MPVPHQELASVILGTGVCERKKKIHFLSLTNQIAYGVSFASNFNISFIFQNKNILTFFFFLHGYSSASFLLGS